TPLVAALAAGHFQTAKFLCDNGAHPDIGGYEDTTPLTSAAFNGDLEMVQVLLKYKADINARDTHGGTPLHSASHGDTWKDPHIASSLSKVARLLLEHGADVNARTNHQSTPLHEAVKYGRVEVVRVLLHHGADVGAKDDNGRT
ncbi:ankyrin repeat-containing domain protein, partial [Russula vinacea]